MQEFCESAKKNSVLNPAKNDWYFFKIQAPQHEK